MNPSIYIVNTPPSWTKTPPLALFYLKNYLTANNVAAEIIDLNINLFKRLPYLKKEWLTLNEDFETNLFSLVEKKFPFFLKSFLTKIKNAEFIGFSLLKRNASFAFSLAEKIRLKYPSKQIVFGGPHTFFLDKAGKLNPHDFWVIGEGEIPLLKIVQNNPQKIYRFEELSELDALPFLDFDGRDITCYSRYIPLLSSRGCIYNCSFCSEKLLFKKFRHHSPKYIVEQINLIIRKYGINTFIFCDSMINYENQWLESFCDLIIKNNLSIKWEAQIRIKKDFPLELARRLKQSGCYNLFIGMESGCDRTLEKMNKKITAKESLNFFKILNKAGLHFEVSLIVGYPQESETDFQETLSFIATNKNLIPKIAQVNPFVDYLNHFPKNSFPNQETIKKVTTLVETLQREKIKYTPAYINNLI